VLLDAAVAPRRGGADADGSVELRLASVVAGFPSLPLRSSVRWSRATRKSTANSAFSATCYRCRVSIAT
jgi:hypothetical protein